MKRFDSLDIIWSYFWRT